MWDPTARREPVVRELECSRDENGVAQATITLTPWSTRERLAYQDGALAASRLEGGGEDGQPRVRRMDLTAITLLHLRLTVTDCSGFPEGFSFANPEDVQALDVEVFDEVEALAKEVQPVNPAAIKRPEDRKAPQPPAGEPAEDFDEPGGDADPTPTRSTRATRPRR